MVVSGEQRGSGMIRHVIVHKVLVLVEQGGTH